MFLSDLHCHTVHIHRRLAQCLGAGRVRVAGEGDIFRRGRELHGHAEFADHFADTWAYQVHTQHLIGFGIGDNLGEASVSWLILARLLAVKGNLPTL